MDNTMVICVIWALLAPVVMAILSCLADKDRVLRNIVLITIPIMTLFDLIYLWHDYHVLPEFRYVTYTLLHIGTGGLSVKMMIEPLGIMFALLASLLWLPNMIYAIGYMDKNGEQHQRRFFLLLSLSMACVIGIAFAGNMITLLIFYELMTILTYLLVAHQQTPTAIKGGARYVMQLMSPTILFIVLIAFVYNATGRTDFVPAGLLDKKHFDDLGWMAIVLCAYGVTKAALFPMHAWLPTAMVAPTPVSAFLHAVAVVKAGVFTIIKVAVYIFGMQNLRETVLYNGSWLATNLLQVIACITILFATMQALRNTELKKILAYSTITNLAYIIGALATFSETAVKTAIFHMLAHGCGKITLFFAAGSIYSITHKTSYTQIGGLSKSMPITMGCFVVAASSIIGIPLTAGYFSKTNLLLSSAAYSINMLFATTVAVSSIITAIYMIRIVVYAYDGCPAHDNDQVNVNNGVSKAGVGFMDAINEAPHSMTMPMVFTAAATIFLYFYHGWFLN